MKIWCVEDDASIRDIEIYTLNSTGFEARGFENGENFFAALAQETPDLVILDVMLPGMDGVSILRKMKDSATTKRLPVIMVTAKTSEIDVVKGLDHGADDYLCKPFGIMEFISRVRAVLRRCAPLGEGSVLRAGNLIVNLDERTVTANGNRVNLTFKEFELLKLFLSHPKMVFTRDQLLSNVWNIDYAGETRTVDVHIQTLRQKLGDCGRMIETVRNVGYRLEDGV